MGAGAAQDTPLASSDEAFRMAFLSALATDRADVCKRHLEAGVDVNMPMGRGWTPLMMVADSDRPAPNLVKVLLGQVSPGQGRARLELDRTNVNGRTALMIAAHRGHTDLVKMLLKLGARLDLKDNEGQTALGMAEEHPWVCLALHEAAFKAAQGALAAPGGCPQG